MTEVPHGDAGRRDDEDQLEGPQAGGGEVPAIAGTSAAPAAPKVPEGLSSGDGAVLKIRGLSMSFPGVRALDNVDLTAYPGEIHALLGENGAGKSTLLKTLFGVQQADSGQVWFAGREHNFASPAEALDAGMAMVHQELSLVPQLTAVQNLVLGREKSRAGFVDWAEARRRAEGILGSLGFDARMDVPVSRLSVAQQQVIEIARALSVDARLIILDEPTASLTTPESQALFALLRRLREGGRAIIYVSHRLAEVMELADRLTVLRDGKLVGTRTRNQINTEADLVRLMVGRNLDAIARMSRVPWNFGGGPMIIRLRSRSHHDGWHRHSARRHAVRGRLAVLEGASGR